MRKCTKLTFTFATGADFEEAGSQALLRGDAEALVVWVLLLAGQDGARWREAVSRNSLHLHFFLKIHVDGPGVEREGRSESYVYIGVSL